MQPISSQMFNTTSLATNNTYGVVKGGTGNDIQNGVISINQATGSSSGIIMPGDGYYIDENGKLQEKEYELIEKIITGYAILTEEPEHWYKGETCIEQDLFVEGFIPTSGTWYKHTGENITGINLYYTNGIYYYDGEKYIAYYKNTGTTNVPIYEILTEEVEWEEELYYSRETLIPLFVQPSDWTTNWKNYAEIYALANWGFQYISSSTCPEFIANKYYIPSVVEVIRNYDINAFLFKFQTFNRAISHITGVYCSFPRIVIYTPSETSIWLASTGSAFTRGHTYSMMSKKVGNYYLLNKGMDIYCNMDTSNGSLEMHEASNSTLFSMRCPLHASIIVYGQEI